MSIHIIIPKCVPNAPADFFERMADEEVLEEAAEKDHKEPELVGTSSKEDSSVKENNRLSTKALSVKQHEDLLKFHLGIIGQAHSLILRNISEEKESKSKKQNSHVVASNSFSPSKNFPIKTILVKHIKASNVHRKSCMSLFGSAMKNIVVVPVTFLGGGIWKLLVALFRE